jgi:hypothetical protein
MMRHALLAACLFACTCIATPAGSALPVPDLDFASRYLSEPEAFRLRPFEPPATAAIPAPKGAAPDQMESPDGVEIQPDIADLGLPLPPAIKPIVDPELAPVVPREEFCNLLVVAARNNELPVGFFANLIWQESRFDHRAVSPVGAQGVAQFMPGTAEEVGLDNPFDARDALRASASLLRKLRERFGNLGLAAAAYNAGPGRVMNWLSKRGSLPRETRDYIHTITGEPADRWDDNTPKAPVFRVPARVPCHRVARFAVVEQAERARMEAERERLEAELAEKRRIAEQAAKAARARKAAARRMKSKDARERQAIEAKEKSKGESAIAELKDKGKVEVSSAEAKEKAAAAEGKEKGKTSEGKRADLKTVAARKRAGRTKLATGEAGDAKGKRKD